MNLGVAVKAAFKVPTLRNIELTGPYMHNGSMATLEQVIEFYGRQGNFHNENLHFQVSTISSSINSPANRADLIAYLKAFTDDRVRYEKAPFDHPEVVVPNGHEATTRRWSPAIRCKPIWPRTKCWWYRRSREWFGRTLLPFDQLLAR